MAGRSAEEWEILRRSVAMLAPSQPCQLPREVALELLEELGQRRDRERRVRQLIAELGAALDGSVQPVPGLGSTRSAPVRRDPSHW